MNRIWRVAVAILIVSAFFAGTIYAAASPKHWDDPDKGKTRAEVVAAQKQKSDAFWARYPQWVAEQMAAGVNPSSLPTAPILASVEASAATLAEATDKASAIVHGRVTGLVFRPDGSTVANLEVDELLKGVVGASLEVQFPGGLQPWPDWDHPTLSYLEAAPYPMPGTDVVLFLGSSTGQGLAPQMYTGVYGVRVDGSLVPLEGNPFAGSMTSLNIDGLAAQVEATSSGNQR